MEKHSDFAVNLLAMYKTFLFDLPLAGLHDIVQGHGDRKAVEAQWKKYDAGVRHASLVIDQLYSSPQFGETLQTLLQTFFHWQRVSSEMTTAITPRALAQPTPEESADISALLATLRHLSRTDVANPRPSTPISRDERTEGPALHLQPMADFTMAAAQDWSTYFEPIVPQSSPVAASHTPSSLPALDRDYAAYFEPVNDPPEVQRVTSGRPQPQSRTSQAKEDAATAPRRTRQDGQRVMTLKAPAPRRRKVTQG